MFIHSWRPFRQGSHEITNIPFTRILLVELASRFQSLIFWQKITFFNLTQKINYQMIFAPLYFSLFLSFTLSFSLLSISQFQFCPNKLTLSHSLIHRHTSTHIQPRLNCKSAILELQKLSCRRWVLFGGWSRCARSIKKKRRTIKRKTKVGRTS